MKCAVPQPEKINWRFIDELKSPLWQSINWPPGKAGIDEVSLADGVRLFFEFDDPRNVLETAYSDFKNFFGGVKVSCGGAYKIIFRQDPTGEKESYRIDIRAAECLISSGDTEGIRRAIFYLEDEMCRREGPFLPLGVIERRPFIKTRISRCFFGPIKRPPLNRDELLDDVDYYPDEYLNRLAHEGVNALWLTIAFRDVCPSPFFPEHAKDWQKRLAKLCQTINKCVRYGIKIYAFCIEPMGFGSERFVLNPDELKAHPYFAGHSNERFTYFCTSSPEGLRYIEDCTRFLFTHAPGLGGMITINFGERPTHCYSAVGTLKENNCPRCSKRHPWEVFADTVNAFAKGMHSTAPDAEMLAWAYVPVIRESDGFDIEYSQHILAEIAAHVPDNITFQYNFESGGEVEQFAKTRYANDYWLAWDGPSEIYRKCAAGAITAGARVSAKIQVGCSHEVATVPFVPVPGILYRKYRVMHELKVSTVMQCWYFGNYPGIMNKAAGELSFEPFPATQKEFLRQLAKIDWGQNAYIVARAWECFDEGYSSFPINLSFTWYGPLHNSIVWPLYLFPVDLPISPSWNFTFPLEGGDRIGECICYDHTLAEILILLGDMRKKWTEGVQLLENIADDYTENRARTLDIGLAKAVGIQIASADNLLNFYALREELPYQEPEMQKETLEKMKTLVQEEIHNSFILQELCFQDSRLGFHSEAEGYKYFPAKLQWRVNSLRKLLAEDFPKVENFIEENKPLFPEYTGVEPTGKVYRASSHENASWESFDDENTRWQAWHSEDKIYFRVICRTSDTAGKDENISVNIEPCRLWPAQSFIAYRSGKRQHRNYHVRSDMRWQTEVNEIAEGWTAYFIIPLACFTGYYQSKRPLRMNIFRKSSSTDVISSWIKINPWERRLMLETDNPSDLGWLFLTD